jgi:AraC-like DNA-binding protein
MVKPRERVILTLHPDRVLQAKLRSVAASHGLELRFFEEWESLQDDVRCTPASTLVVVDPYWGTTRAGDLSIELSALLHRYPSLAVIAALEVRTGKADHIRRLGAWGVVEVIDLEEEITSRELASRLLAATGQPLRNVIQRALPPYSGGPARSILAVAAVIVVEGRQGHDLARALHVSSRTLSRWCRRAGLPPPKRLLAWMRAMLAAELLDDPGRTVSDVALACGYAADASLRQALRVLVGRTPSELRAIGAFRHVSQAFIDALAEAKRSDKRYRRRARSSPQGDKPLTPDRSE